MRTVEYTLESLSRYTSLELQTSSVNRSVIKSLCNMSWQVLHRSRASQVTRLQGIHLILRIDHVEHLFNYQPYVIHKLHHKTLLVFKLWTDAVYFTFCDVLTADAI